MYSMRREQSELASCGLYSYDKREALQASTSFEVHQGTRIRLPSSLCKPSLRAYFDWEDSWNDDYAKRPVLLDLFSGAGGAALGYYLAGFRIVGIDNRPQPHYPFEFYQADALTFPLEGYDAYHASPPCQSYSISQYMQGVKGAGKYIDDTRLALKETAKPFVIENVLGAPLENPIELSGMSFGLKIIRRRLFELSGFDILLIPAPHQVKNYRAEGYLPYHHGTSVKRGHLPNIWTKPRLEKAMQIDWMDIRELTQAIPPAYTEYIGLYLLRACVNIKA